MATYALIHGGGGSAWDWHLVAPELRSRGQEVVAIDLPTEDPAAGLWEYADAVVEAVGDRRPLVVVAHSFGAFTAPLVCARLPTQLLVLLAGMIPLPGEAPGDWWTTTGHEAARRAASGSDLDFGDEDALIDAFLHDVPPELAREELRRGRESSDTPLTEQWPLDAWPDVPTRYLICRDDRYFPAGWLRGVVHDRLGIEPDQIDGGHCVYLSRPRELAGRLEELRSLVVT